MIAGNVNWRDYTLAADVRLSRCRAATLMASVDSADVFKDGKAPYQIGYVQRAPMAIGN